MFVKNFFLQQKGPQSGECHAGAICDENSLINVGNISLKTLLFTLEYVSMIQNEDFSFLDTVCTVWSHVAKTNGNKIIALGNQYSRTYKSKNLHLVESGRNSADQMGKQ